MRCGGKCIFHRTAKWLSACRQCWTEFHFSVNSRRARYSTFRAAFSRGNAPPILAGATCGRCRCGCCRGCTLPRQLGDATSRAGIRCRQSKPRPQRPTGAVAIAGGRTAPRRAFRSLDALPARPAVPVPQRPWSSASTVPSHRRSPPLSGTLHQPLDQFLVRLHLVFCSIRSKPLTEKILCPFGTGRSIRKQPAGAHPTRNSAVRPHERRLSRWPFRIDR